MAARRIDVRKASPDKARAFWAKAQDFFRAMRECSRTGNWNGACLAAVHCAISATDALLVAQAGLRSSSRKHEDAADLVAAHIRHPQVKEQAGRLRGILAQKNLIEYMDRSYRQEDALALEKQVERYVGWAQSLTNQ